MAFSIYKPINISISQLSKYFDKVFFNNLVSEVRTTSYLLKFIDIKASDSEAIISINFTIRGRGRSV